MGGDARTEIEHCRTAALEALAAGQPMVAHGWAKSWVSRGGARTIGPWLVYAAAALQLGQGRTAVHSADLGLQRWTEDFAQRAVLRYVRGEVIRRHMKDPKTAQADLDAAVEHVPDWLRPQAEQAAAECRDAAAVSRKRKPSVGPAPGFTGGHASLFNREVVDLDPPIEEAPPLVWPAVERILHSDDPRVPAERRWLR